MLYIPDSGGDAQGARRTYLDRADMVFDNWPDAKSVVDFGAYRGRLLFELVNEGAADCGVGVEALESPLFQPSDNLEWVAGKVSPRELGKIIRDAPGDTTVLALSVLHHQPDWLKFASVIERNAEFAFIETSDPREVLPEAKAQDQAAAIRKWCGKRGVEVGRSPGWDRRFERVMWFMEF